MLGAQKKLAVASFFPHRTQLLELIHRVVFTRCFQSSFATEVILVVVAHVRTGHVLMLDTSDTLTDFLALNASNITQHTLVTEVLWKSVV